MAKKYKIIEKEMRGIVIEGVQKKYPYFDFFEEEGIAELTRAYGDMDERIAELFPNHIELKREKALCKGDGYCDFLYYNVSVQREEI